MAELYFTCAVKLSSFPTWNGRKNLQYTSVVSEISILKVTTVLSGVKLEPEKPKLKNVLEKKVIKL